MGCDIHAYIEYRNPKAEKEYWNSLGGLINPGRNYRLFGRIAAGVRSDSANAIPLRGTPEILGFKASSDAHLYVTETPGDDHVTPEKADKYVRECGCKYMDERKRFVTHPDWHSHSWITPSELAAAIEDTGEDHEYLAVLAAMQSLESSGFVSRLVFWFDN